MQSVYGIENTRKGKADWSSRYNHVLILRFETGRSKLKRCDWSIAYVDERKCSDSLLETIRTPESFIIFWQISYVKWELPRSFASSSQVGDASFVNPYTMVPCMCVPTMCLCLYLYMCLSVSSSVPVSVSLCLYPYVRCPCLLLHMRLCLYLCLNLYCVFVCVYYVSVSASKCLIFLHVRDHRLCVCTCVYAHVCMCMSVHVCDCL